MLGTLRKSTFSSIGLSSTWADLPFWQREMILGNTPFMTSGVSGGRKETIESNFEEVVQKAYKTCGPIFACILARAMPFSEARFQFQELVAGRPGRLTDGPGLEILEHPWPNGTTGELLWRMEQDASLAGNSYTTRRGDRLRRLRPDWMTIVSGVRNDPEASAFDLEAELLGYIYQPQGMVNRPNPVFLTPAQVVHYSPIPDPEAQWRGMSWIQPIVDDVLADKEATGHKLKYFKNGASSNLVVTYNPDVSSDEVVKFASMFNEEHTGTSNAYKTIHLGGGADAKVLGADMKSIDFHLTQGAGESRIASAAGVGAIIARFSEGMQGSSLNQGNYTAAVRQFTDMTIRPLWRMVSGSLEKFVPPPSNHRLWTDTRDVEFLKENRKDASEILGKQAETIKSLVDAGYEPDAVIDAVEAGDLSRLTGKHSGLYSVQLQRPGANKQDELPEGGTK